MVLVYFTGKDVGETVLYFGCRHRNEDFLYQQELEEFERAGVLTQLNVAFSRDQEHKVSVYIKCACIFFIYIHFSNVEAFKKFLTSVMS